MWESEIETEVIAVNNGVRGVVLGFVFFAEVGCALEMRIVGFCEFDVFEAFIWVRLDIDVPISSCDAQNNLGSYQKGLACHVREDGGSNSGKDYGKELEKRVQGLTFRNCSRVKLFCW